MNTCFIALGSNLENPQQQVINAAAEISQLGNTIAQSSWYRSKPVGPGKQDDYINGVLCLETLLSANELLKQLQIIENNHGRERHIRWGARTLDLDILLFNQDVFNTKDLTIPHPRMLERNFVIYPLCDIAPTLLLSNNQTVLNIKNSLSSQGLEKIG